MNCCPFLTCSLNECIRHASAKEAAKRLQVEVRDQVVGFTLIELPVVLAIIDVFGALLPPDFEATLKALWY